MHYCFKILFFFTFIFTLNAEQEIIILLGPPGSGKGTQAETLRNEASLLHISTGDLIRGFLKTSPQDPTALEMKGYMEKGELVPDRLIIDILGKRLQEPDAQKGIILDGFPRTVPQAEALDRLLGTNGKILVINFDVPDEKIINRLEGRLTCPNCQAIYNTTTTPPKIKDQCDKCQSCLIQRKDDTLETIKNRLDVYKKETQPLIQYYKDKGVLKTINADQDKNTIENQVRSIYKDASVPSN